MHLQNKYIDAICHEMDIRSPLINKKNIDKPNNHHHNNIIKTIYFGGGTPSQLPPSLFEKIFTHINESFICKPEETTVEMNPDDVTPNIIEKLKQYGVNRISMGAQTFDNRRLKFFGRRHTAEQIEYAIRTIQNKGIDNISIDLMFGFPDESIKEWSADVKRAIDLDVSHISAYSLMYEEGTPLYKMLQDGEIKEIDDEVSLKMYELLMELTTNAGFEHYEISNFAKKGFRSKHNSGYWQDIPYFGIGASAHSYDLSTRSWNVDNINCYITAIENGILPYTEENIDDDTHYNDIVTTALRTSWGINLKKLKPHYREFAIKQSSKLIDEGLIEIYNNHLRLTRKALFISDMVMSELIIT